MVVQCSLFLQRTKQNVNAMYMTIMNVMRKLFASRKAISSIVPFEQTKSVRWSDELFVSQEFEISNEEKAERKINILDIHGKMEEITFFSTPLTNFTPSRPPALGLKDGSSREKIDGLQEICFDLFPEEMDLDEVESSDTIEPMVVVQTEKAKKPKLRRSKRIAALKKKSQPLRRSARIAALRKKGNM